MKKHLYSLSLLLSSLILAIFLTSCAKNSQTNISNALPTLEIVDTKISSLSLDSITLDTKVKIYNPLGINFNPSRIDINIYYQDMLITANNVSDNISLAALKDNDIVLKSTFKILDLINIIKDYKTLDYLPFRIEIKVAFSIARAFSLLNNITLSDSIMLQIPTINPQLSLKQITHKPPFGVSATFNLKDKANFNLDDISYKLKLDKDSFNGVVKSHKNADESIDIMIENLNVLNLITASFKNISLEFETSLKFDGLDYKIPIHIKKNFYKETQ